MKNKNTYETTDLTYSGANKHMSGLHNKCIRTNQYVWDMMKVLDREKMYGFHFQTKVGERKILVLLHHEDKEELENAQKLLKNVERNPDILFLTKLKEKKKTSKLWISLFISIFLLVIVTFIVSFLYKQGYFNLIIEQFQPKEISQKTTIKEELVEKALSVEEIVVDIEKLKLLKEGFEQENNATLSPNVMKALSMTTGIISEMVSEEEKAKYSSEALVKSFKGKGGFKLVVKDNGLNKDFNNTVQELNAYAMHFVKENNLSEALKYYDKVSKEENVSKREIMISTYHQAEIFEEMGLNEEAKRAYEGALALSGALKENNQTVDALNELISLGNLAQLHQNLNETKRADEIKKQSEYLYKLLIDKLKKQGEVKLEELAFALNFLANFYRDNDEHLLAIEIGQEALKIYEKLFKKEHKKFALEYYKSLNALGASYLTTGELKLAKKKYEMALVLMQKLVKSKVVKNRAYMALSYRALAMVEIKHKRLQEAKRYYVDALKIYELLVKKEKDYVADIAEMDGEFAGLYGLEKKFKLAGEAYQKGILKLVQMNKERPLKYNLKIAKLLNQSALMKISNYDMNSTKVIQAKVELKESIKYAEELLEVNFKRAKKSIAESYAYLAYIVGSKQNMELALEYYKIYYALNKVKGINAFRLLNLNFQ